MYRHVSINHSDLGIGHETGASWLNERSGDSFQYAR